MKDPIERQDAIDALCSRCAVSRPETCSTIQDGDKWCEEVYTLLNLPSAQPEIIHCRDCKYNADTHKCLNPNSFFLIPNDDDFCSFAERREE